MFVVLAMVEACFLLLVPGSIAEALMGRPAVLGLCPVSIFAVWFGTQLLVISSAHASIRAHRERRGADGVQHLCRRFHHAHYCILVALRSLPWCRYATAAFAIPLKGTQDLAMKPFEGTPYTPDRLVVTVPEAAKLLGISRSLAYEAARSGELPGVIRIGRRVVVSRARLLAEFGIAEASGNRA